MQLFDAEGSAVLRFVQRVSLTLVACLGAVSGAWAANTTITAQTERFDCASRKPGDIITLASGQRGPLVIQNCKGTASDPIIIRNDPDGNAPVVIRRTSGSGGGFIFSCNDCVGVEIDGSYKWKGAPGGKTYGIKVTMTGGKGPSSFVRIGGAPQNLTIRNLEIDGAWPKLPSNGSGIRLNDNRYTKSKYPGRWREKILIEDNYIHDIKTSGMYIGPNYNNGELPLRDIEIRHNLVEDTGFDGISAKSMLSGNNQIHHNTVRRAGKSSSTAGEQSQYSGIKNTSGTVKIYNNWVDTTGQHGIVSWTAEGPKISAKSGALAAHIWNNVIVNAGKLWRPFMLNSFGIKVGAEDGCEKPFPNIYSNTVVNSRQGAIQLGSNVGAGIVRDNIAAGSGGNPVIGAPGFVKLVNNSVGSVSQMNFVDVGRNNFRLRTNSPAWNGGSGDFPPTDFDDLRRPRDGTPDQGAFEGSK